MTIFIAAAAVLSLLVMALLLRPLLAKKASRALVASLALAVPLAAAALYGVIGNTNAVTGQAAAAHADPQIEKMLSALAARLEKDPGDKKGWAMLARSYKVVGRPVESERAYDMAGDFLDNDAEQLAHYADVVATNAGGKFNDKAVAVLKRALRADPNNTMALWLAGNAAFEAGDAKGAADTWTKLLALLPPDSDDARELRNAIVQAGGTVPPVAAVAQAPATGASVTGTVELDPKLKAAPGDIVMVIARAPGQRMPLAVMRVPAASFPLAFTLDDSLAMSPQARISGATEVEVEARISKTGQATPQPGDLLSTVQTVKVGAKGVNLRVANVRG